MMSWPSLHAKFCKQCRGLYHVIASAILTLIGKLNFVDTVIEMHFQDKYRPLPPIKTYYD
jgi:hypothetical protein